MPLVAIHSTITGRPIAVVAAWLILAAVVAGFAPDLTRLAAEGQANLLGPESESIRAKALAGRIWPDQVSDSTAVAALHRPGGLVDADRDYARRLELRLKAAGRPAPILRVLGPTSQAEVASRLISKDGTTQLVAATLATSFVAPATQTAVGWVEGESGIARPPEGLEVHWTGDAVLGRAYMANVQTSLDRAAIATVFLLLIVLLAVYRSIWVALVPLTTIGLGLLISRGVLAWLAQAGWEISSLVELFLVAVLFGCGTDFCLFISWRFGEQWDPADPARAMSDTLDRSMGPLLTSAGTVIVGLLLMGTTQFKLFSSTGPSVALGLAITLLATLSFSPAALVLLARHRPQAFAGLTAPSSGFWGRFGRLALRRPLLSWIGAMLLMVPFALIGARTRFTHDLLLELPSETVSARNLKLIADQFGPGIVSPLSVVLTSDVDLRGSEGLDLIDEVGRLLARSRGLVEIRSATQPLGSPAPLDPARIASRLGQVNQGLVEIGTGSARLESGLNDGAAKLRAALLVEKATGLNLTRPVGSVGAKDESGNPAVRLAQELTEAADGAGQIAGGASRAGRELTSILTDPVGKEALDRLLVNASTLRDHPELRRSFDTYIAPNGKVARIDLIGSDRVFSAPALDLVNSLRRKLTVFLHEARGPTVRAQILGANAEAVDVRSLTRSDQVQSWFLVPAGVFLVLLITLRDPMACMNLVATMLLSYVFALGATHLLFITALGAEGLDWKVPYFLFVLLVAVGVDYNIFLMTRLREESATGGFRSSIVRAVGRTGGLISSAAAITACSFASFLTSPLSSLRQLGFALVIGIGVDALIVRPLLVPCGHWLLNREKPWHHGRRRGA